MSIGTLANLTAQVALLQGGIDKFGGMMEDMGKDKDKTKTPSQNEKSNTNANSDTAENTSKIVKFQKFQIDQQTSQNKKLLSTQEKMNNNLLNGFSDIQTQVLDAINGLSTHMTDDQKHQKAQSILAGKQAWDQFQVSKHNANLFAGMRHMSEQNYVAVNQVATEIVKMHGSMIGSTKEQKDLEIRKMKLERHGHLRREQQIGQSIEKFIEAKGLKGKAWTISDLEKLSGEGNGDAKDTLKMIKYAQKIRHGVTLDKYNETQSEPISKKDAEVVAKFVKRRGIPAGNGSKSKSPLGYKYVKGANVSGFDQQRHDTNKNRLRDEVIRTAARRDENGNPLMIMPNMHTLPDFLKNVSMMGVSAGGGRGWKFSEDGEAGLASGKYKMFDHKKEGRSGKTPGLYNTETGKFIEQAQLSMEGGSGALLNPTGTDCCDSIKQIVLSNASILDLMEKKDARDIQARKDMLEAKNDAMFAGGKKGGLGALLGKGGGSGGGFLASIGNFLKGNLGAVATAAASIPAYKFSKNKLNEWKSSWKPNKPTANGVPTTDPVNSKTANKTANTMSKVIKGSKTVAKTGLKILAPIEIGDKMQQGQGVTESVINTGHDLVKGVLGVVDLITPDFQEDGTSWIDKYTMSQSDAFGNADKWTTSMSFFTQDGGKAGYKTGATKFKTGIDWKRATKLGNAAENVHGVVDVGSGISDIEDLEGLAKLPAQTIEALIAQYTWSDGDEKLLKDILNAKLEGKSITYSDGGWFGFENIKFGKKGTAAKFSDEVKVSGLSKASMNNSYSGVGKAHDDLNGLKWWSSEAILTGDELKEYKAMRSRQHKSLSGLERGSDAYTLQKHKFYDEQKAFLDSKSVDDDEQMKLIKGIDGVTADKDLQDHVNKMMSEPGSAYVHDIHTESWLEKIYNAVTGSGGDHGYDENDIDGKGWGKGKSKPLSPGEKAGAARGSRNNKKWMKDVEEARKRGEPPPPPPVVGEDYKPVYSSLVATQSAIIGNNAMQGSKWFNKGYIPGEEKWSLAKHWVNETSQLTRSNQAFRTGANGLSTLRPLSAFSTSGTLGTGPTAGFRNISKFGSRALPGLGAGLAGWDMTNRINNDDYLGAALSAGSAVPGWGLLPLGLQMGTDAMGWTGQQSKSIMDGYVPITNLQPNEQFGGNVQNSAPVVIDNTTTNNNTSSNNIYAQSTAHSPSLPNGVGSSLEYSVSSRG